MHIRPGIMHHTFGCFHDCVSHSYRSLKLGLQDFFAPTSFSAQWDSPGTKLEPHTRRKFFIIRLRSLGVGLSPASRTMIGEDHLKLVDADELVFEDRDGGFHYRRV